MIVPELKGFDCSDHDSIESWSPGSEPVLYRLSLLIGEPGNPAADLFDVPVANHAGLHLSEWKRRTHRSIVPIVVDPYSWSGVLSEIQRRLASASSHDWLSVLDKLRAEFAWEYEGM